MNPNDYEGLQEIIDHHLETLSHEDKHGMLMEYFNAIRDYVTAEGTEDVRALSQCVYSAHLFIRIFEDLYDKAEQTVVAQEHLQNCFDK